MGSIELLKHTVIGFDLCRPYSSRLLKEFADNGQQSGIIIPENTHRAFL